MRRACPCGFGPALGHTAHSQEWLCYSISDMTYYERNLPHWHPEGRILFVTWRLSGSLPEYVVTRLRNTKEPAGRQFARAEQFLDKGSFGSLWLRNPQIANCVQLSILRGARELDQYALLAYVVRL